MKTQIFNKIKYDLKGHIRQLLFQNSSSTFVYDSDEFFFSFFFFWKQTKSVFKKQLNWFPYCNIRDFIIEKHFIKNQLMPYKNSGIN